jgi:phosphonate transport system substrate-binding protein
MRQEKHVKVWMSLDGSVRARHQQREMESSAAPTPWCSCWRKGLVENSAALRTGILSIISIILLLWSQKFWAEVITIGSLHIEPAREVNKFLPLANFLSKELKPEGIDQGKVVVAHTIAEMASFVREAKVDLYIDSVFPTLAVSRLSGSKPLLRRWKKGVSEYSSVLFVRKDSGMKRLDDLKGKVIAFDEPYSSSGYFLPKLALMQVGLRLVAKEQHSGLIGPGEVGYVFSSSDENTLLWVLRGKVQAGALDNWVYDQKASAHLQDLTVLYKSPLMPRQLVSFRANLPAKLVARIKEVLTKMDQSEDGRKALQAFERTTKFDELSDQTLSALSKLQDYVAAEIRSR